MHGLYLELQAGPNLHDDHNILLQISIQAGLGLSEIKRLFNLTMGEKMFQIQ